MNLPPLPQGIRLHHLGEIGPLALRSGAAPGTWVCQLERWRPPRRLVTVTGPSAPQVILNALRALETPIGPAPKLLPSLSDLFS